MFKLVKVSMEGLIALTVLGFLAVWVVLQEYGTVLIWLLIGFLTYKLVKAVANGRTKYIFIVSQAEQEENAKGWSYPHRTVSEPVAIDRYSLLNKPFDTDQQ